MTEQQQYPTREQIDEAMVERAARAMFEGADGLIPGDYSWDDVVREDKGRADLWRADARAVLLAALPQPTPSTDMTAMSHETTGFCFCGQMHGLVNNWNEYDWAALRTHAPAAPEA